MLFQCLSESLTNSGVMANFEKAKKRDATDHSSEWADSHKTKWFDLSPIERTEAASQVHAVVTAQLGALAHSMIEFNCPLERSCAFVRRMAIRNQLPLSQRSILLQHLLDRKNDIDLSKTLSGTSPTNGEDDQENISPSDATDSSQPTMAAASKLQDKDELSTALSVPVIAGAQTKQHKDENIRTIEAPSLECETMRNSKDGFLEEGKEEESAFGAAVVSATGKETAQPTEQQASEEDGEDKYTI